MNSINQNQTEDTHEDLIGAAAIARMKEMIEDSPNCFFTTHEPTGRSHTRPMNVRKIDDAGILWFLSSVDSHKNEELETNRSVELYFQGSKHSDFLHLKGFATILRDQARINDLWEPTIKTWFTEGREDPRITVIRVEPDEGYYWDTKHGNTIAGIKMMFGAAIGKTMDDSIEGELSP